MQPPVDHVLVRTTKPKAAAAVRIGAGLGQQKRVELAGLLQVCFARVEPWLQARKYVSAVASGLARRNGGTIAEQAGGRGPGKTQRRRDPAASGAGGAGRWAPGLGWAGCGWPWGGARGCAAKARVWGGFGKPGARGRCGGSVPLFPGSWRGGGGGGPARGPPARGQRPPAAGRSAP